MSAESLFREGRLAEAIQAAGAVLRDDPANAKQRTFLFELLCFAGEYDRAEKHLALLGEGNKDREMGGLLYRAAIHAERLRADLFAKGEWPSEAVDGSIEGTLNGVPFSSIEDSDPRIGARLEIFAAGSYLWVPFNAVEQLAIEPPRRVRDLLWAPGRIKTGPAFQSFELGEVLLPVISPFSWRHADQQVRLGRQSVWEEEDGAAIPYGQKSLLVDGEEIPFLEIRSLTIGPPQEGSDGTA